jgi:hypothetical protein
MFPLGTSIIDVFFIGLFVFVFGFVIYYNVTEIRSARKRLREHDRPNSPKCN